MSEINLIDKGITLANQYHSKAIILGNQYYRHHFNEEPKKPINEENSDYGCTFKSKELVLREFVEKDNLGEPIFIKQIPQLIPKKISQIKVIFNKNDLIRFFEVSYHLIRSGVLFLNENFKYSGENKLQIKKAVKKGVFCAHAIKRLKKIDKNITEVEEIYEINNAKDSSPKDYCFKLYAPSKISLYKNINNSKNINDMKYFDLINYSSIYGVTECIGNEVTVPKNTTEIATMRVIFAEVIKDDFKKMYEYLEKLCAKKINDKRIKIDTKNTDIPLNLLLKGVPGTGKSRLIDQLIIKLGANEDQVLRINIHNGTNNSDLMQGIGVQTTENNEIIYKEKQGVVLNHLLQAIVNHSKPYILVLEEIQENSLNKIIGDLIYLIEPSKRTNIEETSNIKNVYQTIDKVIKYRREILGKETNFVKIPNLVSSDEPRSLIMPNNFYVFCTSNYRDDKKVIEDNLLRRFDVIEMYPDNKAVNIIFKDFFEALNESIEKIMKDLDTHPDRYVIGHANWGIENNFIKAMLKVIVEFKDVKNIEFATMKQILKETDSLLVQKGKSINDLINNENEEQINILDFDSYKSLIIELQNKAYKCLIG